MTVRHAIRGGGDGRGHRFRLVAVDPAGVPARGLETGERVVAGGECRVAVDADVVVVEQHDQFRQAVMPGQ
jgi:hypothetical protein